MTSMDLTTIKNRPQPFLQVKTILSRERVQMYFQFVAEVGGMMAFFLGISLISLIGMILSSFDLVFVNLFLLIAIFFWCCLFMIFPFIHLSKMSCVLFLHPSSPVECCCYGAFVCRRRWCGPRGEVDAETLEAHQQPGERGRKKKGEGRGGGEGVEEEEDEKERSRWRREYQREMAARAARQQANA